MDIVDDWPNYPTIFTGDLNGGLSSQVITKIQNSYGYTTLHVKLQQRHRHITQILSGKQIHQQYWIIFSLVIWISLTHFHIW